MARSSAVVSPNLGLYYDRPSIALSERMLLDGVNFRVKEGRLSNLNLGWERFGTVQLNGPVTLIDQFFIRGQDERLIFGTPSDLYVYDGATDTVAFITPSYSEGTASVNGKDVTGTASGWSTSIEPGHEISFGDNDENSPDATWWVIATVNGDGSLTLEEDAGVIADGPYTIRQTFKATFLDTWDTDIFVNAAPDNKDWWIATNGIDDVIRWDGQSRYTERVGLPFKANTLTVYSNMMIYGNITQSGERLPSTIINSNVGDPFDVSGGLSEQFKVHGGTDGIVNMVPIGDNLALYSSGRITVAQFVGDPLIFVFRQAVNGLGAIAGKAVSDFGDFHEFLGSDSQYSFDGVTLQSIGTQIWREVLRQQDPRRITYAFSHFDEENGDLIWSVPSTQDPGSGDEEASATLAWVEHYLEEVGDNSVPYSKRYFPFTATGYYERKEGLTWDRVTDIWSSMNFRWNDQFFFASFPFNLGGDIDGKIYNLNTSQNQADGSPLPSNVHFGRRALGDGRMRGLLARVYPFASQFENPLQVTVYMSDHAAGPSTSSSVLAFDQTLPEGGHFVSPYRRGRYTEIAFGTSGPSQPWEISGYDIDVKKGGYR